MQMGCAFPLPEKRCFFFFFYLSYRCIPFASAEITRDVEAGSPDAPVPSSSAVKMKPGLGREARELEVTLTSRLQSLALTTSSLH